MDWIVFLFGVAGGCAVTLAAWGLWYAFQPAQKVEFHRIEPERDAIVAQHSAQTKHRVRVTDAHISQPRDYWNGYRADS